MSLDYHKWTRLHSAILVLSTLINYWLNIYLVIVLFPAFSFLIFINLYLIKDQTHWLGGPANQTTLLRLILILSSVILLDWWTILSQLLLIIALILDGIDGYLARKLGTVSETGARFDMEVDAFFVLILTTTVANEESLGWLITLGLLRYIYVLALSFLKISEDREPPSYFKKTATVVLISSLIAALVIYQDWMIYCLVVSTLMILISFTHSAVYQISGKWWPIP